MTLDEIEKKIIDNPDPKTLFGGNVDAELKKFHTACHPDRFAGNPLLSSRAEIIFKKLGVLADEAKKPSIAIRSGERSYNLTRILGIGDIADVHLGICDGQEYVIKISRVPEGVEMLDQEQTAVGKMMKDAGITNYVQYIPRFIESFLVRDKIQKRINVYKYQPGFYTLEEVHAKFPRGLEEKHLAWIFKRLLVATGFAHRCGIIHGSILPCHIQINAKNHGLQLIGWGQSVGMGGKITSGPSNYMNWFPDEVKKKRKASSSTDIFMAAKCMVYLAGGDPAKSHETPTLQPKMARFIRSCLMEGQSMRPEDAWVLHDEFNDILQGMYDLKNFHHLTME